MPRWPLLLLISVICALGLAACGGDDDVDVEKVLQQTFGEDKDIKSGRLDLKLRVDAQGGQTQGPVSLSLNGPFASTAPTELPRFDFDAEVTAGGQTIQAGATSTGDKGFVSLRGQDYAVPDQLFQQFKEGYAQQAKQNEGKDSGVSFKSLGIQPQRWLTNPEAVGNEDVGGTETIHIRSGVDVPRMLEDVNKILARAEDVPGQPAQEARQLSEAERKQVAEAIQDATVDVWTGEEDKILRRINVNLRFDVPEEQRGNAQGITNGTVRFDMSLGAINEDPDIEAPKDTRPLQDLAAAIQGGAAGGGAGPGGAGSGGAAAPEGSGGSAYQQCVAQAAGDVRKLQECAELIGQ